MKTISILLIALTALADTSCITTYDAKGHLIHPVDPRIVMKAEDIGYAIDPKADRQGYYYKKHHGYYYSTYHNGYDYYGYNKYGYDINGYNQAGYQTTNRDKAGSYCQ